jgi:hypothetical protein
VAHDAPRGLTTEESGMDFELLSSVRNTKVIATGWLRVIDESGEDYIYPASRFVPVELPMKGRRALASVG